MRDGNGTMSVRIRKQWIEFALNMFLFSFAPPLFHRYFRHGNVHPVRQEKVPIVDEFQMVLQREISIGIKARIGGMIILHVEVKEINVLQIRYNKGVAARNYRICVAW